MADSKNYVNVNINVNGTVHKVRVQEGVAFAQDDRYDSFKSAFQAQNGSLFYTEEKTEQKKDKYDGTIYSHGTGIFTAKTTNEVKMTEAEFALFKNVADNVKEGDVITLSNADIEKAKTLYKAGKFTDDVTKNLPGGFHGEKGNQELGEHHVTAVVSNYDEGKEALSKAKDEKYKYENAGVAFIQPKAGEEGYYYGINPDLEKYVKLSADGTVKVTHGGAGDGDYWAEYTYTVKNGNKITMSPDYNQNAGNPNKEIMVRKEYTDSDGKRVIETCADCVEIDYKLPNGENVDYGVSMVKTSKTSDGKEVIELYENDNNNKKVLDKVIIDYTENGKKVIEYHDKNGELTSKTKDYEENGKKVHEDYNSDNHMTGKFAEYTQGKKSIKEIYDGQNKYIGKEVKWEDERGGTDYQKYNSNNKLTESYVGDKHLFYENGVLTRQRISDYNNIYYKNGKFSHQVVKKVGTRYNTYDCVLNQKGKITKCGDFNVEAEVRRPLSEKAKEYRKEFTGKSAKEIAKTLKGQIDGPSFNDKTLAMIDAIPTEQFLKVMKEYAQTGGIWFGNKANLFKDLMNEWNMKDNALVRVAKKAYASYLLNKTEKGLSGKDIDMAQKAANTNPEGDKVKEFVSSIEEHIMK